MLSEQFRFENVLTNVKCGDGRNDAKYSVLISSSYQTT